LDSVHIWRLGIHSLTDHWLDHVKAQVSPRSYERYCELARKNIIPRLGAIAPILDTVTPAECANYFANAGYHQP
jgi:hypothetical protein